MNHSLARTSVLLSLFTLSPLTACFSHADDSTPAATQEVITENAPVDISPATTAGTSGKKTAETTETPEITENPETSAAASSGDPTEPTVKPTEASERGFPLEWIDKSERRWTFPGEIKEHLLGDRHRFTEEQLDGLTEEELINLHSNHHIHDLIPVGRRVLNDDLVAAGPEACQPRGVKQEKTNSASRQRADAATACQQDLAESKPSEADSIPAPPQQRTTGYRPATVPQRQPVLLHRTPTSHPPRRLITRHR